jgi:hypothetical protein
MGHTNRREGPDATKHNDGDRHHGTRSDSSGWDRRGDRGGPNAGQDGHGKPDHRAATDAQAGVQAEELAWKTASPALHLDAAQAPLSVTQIGARSPKVAYAFGSGQVADVTSDGGKHWYRALFNGTDMAVVPGFGSKQLLTFVDAGSSSSGPSGPVWQYASSNGGKTWKLSPGS